MRNIDRSYNQITLSKPRDTSGETLGRGCLYPLLQTTSGPVDFQILRFRGAWKSLARNIIALGAKFGHSGGAA